MRLLPREVDRLLLRQAAELARSRQARGLLLSEPEARAIIADTVCEGARGGGTVTEMVSIASGLLTEDDVMEGVSERLDAVMVEGFFPDGQKLVCISTVAGAPHRPRWRLGEQPVIINTDRPTVTLRVQSTADRPIQLGSHYHFFEVNPALRFDRAAAYGFRLDVPAATTVRFEPGDTRLVDLVAIGGARVVYGLAGLVNGALDDPTVRSAAMIRLESFLQE